MQKRSQAAMEFLLTYGWAIMVVLVAICSLAYFGVLDGRRFFPTYCTIYSSQIWCGDSRLYYSTADDTDYLVLNLKNNVGQTITVNKIRIKQNQDFPADTSSSGQTLGPKILNNGDPYTTLPTMINMFYTSSAPPYHPSNSKRIVDFTIEVVHKNSGLTQYYQGELTTTVS